MGMKKLRTKKETRIERPRRAKVSEKEALKRMKDFVQGKERFLPLLERVRVDIYLPDLPSSQYENLLRSFEEELTYSFGGCSILRGLEGSYLSEAGDRITDRINVIYSDAPLALSMNADKVARYVGS